MSFFSRKPNPPVPASAMPHMKRAAAQGHGLGAVGPLNHQGTTSPNVAKSTDEQQAPSNARFRSFAERYLVERCRDWKESEIDDRAWEAILQARTIYNKVKEVGRTLGSDQ
jgi:hypothetical protein